MYADLLVQRILQTAGRAAADAFDAALGPLGDALQLRPAYAEALLERAYALQRLGDAPGARADLLAADALAPGDVRVARALRALG